MLFNMELALDRRMLALHTVELGVSSLGQGAEKQ